jgi:hypothetical protein
MAKVVLDDIGSGYNLSKINSNFQKIEDELNDKVLYRNNPVGEANQLDTQVDANSERIINLPDAVTAGEPLTLRQYLAGAVGQQSVGISRLETTAIEGQILFTTPAYVIGSNNLNVYVNGVRQAGSAYTETSDSSITFSEGLAAGDLVEAIVNEYPELNGTIAATAVTYRSSNVNDLLDDVVNVKAFGAVGNGVADDTAAIKAAMDYAKSLLSASVLFPEGEYLVSGRLSTISASAWKRLSIRGDSAKITVSPSSSVFDYLLYVNSTTNMDFTCTGLEIEANSRVASPVYVDVRDASPSTLTASGRCYIDIGVKNAKKDSSITAIASGVTVIGAFEEINIKGIVDGVDRDNHASTGNECKGIGVSDLVGTCRVGATVKNISTPDVDADGISVFGRERGTKTDPDDFIFKQGVAYICNSTIKECEGRHVKVQTSEAHVCDNSITQEEGQMIAQSVSIAAQYGNGQVKGNEITYRKTGGGLSPIGSSHSVFDIANVLTDQEMQALVNDNVIKTEVVLPRIIAYDVDNTALSSTVLKKAELSASGNKVISIEDLAGSPNVTRSFVEFAADNIVDNDGVDIELHDNKMYGATAAKLIGYTGYNGTDDLKSKLSITAIDNTNQGTNDVHVFDPISGSRIGLIEKLKLNSNTGLDHFFQSMNFDLNNLPGGTDFTYDISSSTVANTPASYPASGTAWIKTGNNSFNNTWFPQEMTLEDGTRLWKRVSTTWRTLI